MAAPIVAAQNPSSCRQAGADDAMGRTSVNDTPESSKPRATDADTAGSDGAQTGENVCPRCGGSGRVGADRCPTCDGSGRVEEIVGDA
jgi:DnaJ-class molecular chaperone